MKRHCTGERSCSSDSSGHGVQHGSSCVQVITDLLGIAALFDLLFSGLVAFFFSFRTFLLLLRRSYQGGSIWWGGLIQNDSQGFHWCHVLGSWGLGLVLALGWSSGKGSEWGRYWSVSIISSPLHEFISFHGIINYVGNVPLAVLAGAIPVIYSPLMRRSLGIQ